MPYVPSISADLPLSLMASRAMGSGMLAPNVGISPVTTTTTTVAT